MSKDNNEFMQRELERFSQSFELLLEHSKERDIKVDAIMGKIDAIMVKVDEMYKPFTDGRTVGSAVYWFGKWGFGTILAVGGAYLMFKNIFHGDN